MNLPPSLEWWREASLALAVGVAVVVLLSAAASRFVLSGSGQRTIWRVGQLGLLLLVAGEWTGLGRGMALWLRARWPEHAPLRSAVDRTARDSEAAADHDDSLLSTGGVTEPDTLTAGATAGEPDQPGQGHPLQTTGTETVAAALPLDAEPDGQRTGSLGLVAMRSWWPGIIWFTGVLVLAGRVLVSRVVLVTFRARHGQLADDDLASEVAAVASQLGFRGAIRVMRAGRLSAPIAFGVLRPTVGLPERFAADFDGPERQVMLAHEVAHLAARDPAWHVLADGMGALLWWHPLVWWSRRRLRAASEWAADEASRVVPDGPRLLAACLVELAGRLVRRESAAWQAIAGHGFRSSLGRRVQRLLCLSVSPRRPCRRLLGLGARIFGPVAMVAAALISIAGVLPAPLAKGDSIMNSMWCSWRQSLAALTVFTMFGTGASGSLSPADSPPQAADLGANLLGTWAVQKPEKQPLDDGAVAELKAKLKKLEIDIKDLRAAGKNDEADKLTKQGHDLKAALGKHLADKSDKPSKGDKLGGKKPTKTDADDKKPVKSGDAGDKKPVKSGDAGDKKPVKAGDAGDKKPVKAGDAGDKRPAKAGAVDDKGDKPTKGPKKEGTADDNLAARVKELEIENAKLRSFVERKDAKDAVTALITALRAAHQDQEALAAGQKERAEAALTKARAMHHEKLQLHAKDVSGKAGADADTIKELGAALKDLGGELNRLRDEVAELRRLVKESKK
jgi:hypothetical protein